MTNNQIWEEVTDNFDREHDGERWLRRIDSHCWISALYRLTGFGYHEWETAIVFRKQLPEGQKETWKDRDVLIIAGDRREELGNMPKEKLREWYDNNIKGNKCSFDTKLENLQEQLDNLKN